MRMAVLTRLRRAARRIVATVLAHIPRLAAPLPLAVAAGAAADVARGRCELALENALLRQQVLILRRRAKRPHLTALDRGLILLLASRLRTWAQTRVIVQPATVLRWQRHGFRLLWRRKSRPQATAARIPAETSAVIRRMAVENPLWGADRIRGELLKRDIRVSKRTIQKYMRSARPRRPAGQTWSTCVHHHAHEIWACDFLPVTDLFFRPLHAFFVVARGSRRVIHVGVTRHPTDAWVAQQLREATPFGEGPRFLIRDNDSTYGPRFDHVAATSRIRVLRTPVRAPRANATCERFLGSVRRACLDHLLVLSEAHLRRVLRTYAAYFNQARPHQGLGQAIPTRSTTADRPSVDRPGAGMGRVVALPILGGLHHDYHRVA